MKRARQRSALAEASPASIVVAALAYLLVGAAGCGSHDKAGPMGSGGGGQPPVDDATATGGMSPDGSAGAGGSSGAGGAPLDGPGRSDGATISDGPSGPNMTAGPEGAGAFAFNSISGTLNVDYASYLSKHDIVYSRANTNPLFGLTVGNGRMGAMVWSANGLTMQVGGVDASQQSAFSSGLVNLNTT